MRSPTPIDALIWYIVVGITAGAAGTIGRPTHLPLTVWPLAAVAWPMAVGRMIIETYNAEAAKP